MDILSLLLQAVGWSKQKSAKIQDLRSEAFRLNAEVAGECIKSINMIALATPGLELRLSKLCAYNSDAFRTMTERLKNMREQSQQLLAMAEKNKKLILDASPKIDWHILTCQLYEWRATADNLCPYTEGIIKYYGTMISEEELAQSLSSVATINKAKNKGWDAPPL